jgi:uncharacterized protein (TIGR02996 family)
MQDAFLRALLESPRDDISRQVYADWLTEQDTPVAARQAEYLRLTVLLADADLCEDQRETYRTRLRELADGLDAAWLAVVSRIPVENCGRRRVSGLFSFVCDHNWTDMQPTADPVVRQCEHCYHAVVYCDTIQEALHRADAGHCIAVAPGIIRQEHDLALGHGRLLAGRAVQYRLRVIDGNFAGMEGEIIDITEDHVRVMLTILGRPVPVDFEFWQVVSAVPE